MVVVLIGPGGVGKGTIAAQLVQRDPSLWLSRSWTTRARRPKEAEDAYVFVDRATFEQRIADDGFLEWNEFLGELYGTPVPETPDGRDLLLEIDVNGAESVRRLAPHALVILVTAPSREVHEARLVGRGDSPERAAERLALGVEEEERGRRLADHVVVNDDLGRAVGEVASILDRHRSNPSA